MSDDERRQHPRIGSSLRCWLRGESRTVYAMLRDLSHGGLCLRAPTTFQPGEVAEVLLEDPHHTRRLRARAEVAWSHPDPHNPDHAGTGLRFIEVVEGLELLPLDGRE